MNFLKSSLILLLLISGKCFSQDDIGNNIRDVTKATFFDPGISYEKSVGKLQSLTARAFLSSVIAIGYSSSLGNTSSINIYPALSLQYRYYYNTGKRKSKGKRTEMNSANYLAGLTEMYFYKESILSETNMRTQKTMGITWGFQRNYASRFSVDLSFGLGYVFTKQTTINDAGQIGTINTGEFTNVGQIALGFWLNRKK